MADSNFAWALREQLVAHGKTRGIFGRLISLIDSKPSKRRTRILDRIENLTRMHLTDQGVLVGIDWSSIDWLKLFELILQFLAAILPLFFMAKNAKMLKLAVVWLVLALTL